MTKGFEVGGGWGGVIGTPHHEGFTSFYCHATVPRGFFKGLRGGSTNMRHISLDWGESLLLK